MKILIADDHALYRKGLRDLVQQLNTDITDILEADNWQTALGLLSDHPDAALAIVDLNMPGMQAYNGLQAVLDQTATVPIVVVTASESPVDMKRVLDTGAMGYIAKSEKAAVMLSALRLVLDGGIYVPPKLIQTSQPIPATRSNALPFGLTPRQYDVLEGMIQGKSNKEIAKQLSLTERTVKSHISAIFKALGVSNRQQAIKAATQPNP